MPNIKSLGHTASEMSFEIVDEDGRRIPTYPISSPLSLQLRGAKIEMSLLKFTFKDSETEIVYKYKYLGTMRHYNGNFKHAAEHVYQKSLKVVSL